MFVLLYLIGFGFMIAISVLAIIYITRTVNGKDSEETLGKYKEILEKKAGDFDTELNAEDELNFEDDNKTIIELRNPADEIFVVVEFEKKEI